MQDVAAAPGRGDQRAAPRRACTSGTTATPSCSRRRGPAPTSPSRDGRFTLSQSYVEDIMGPMCFDYGFGPFRWVCTSGDPTDLATHRPHRRRRASRRWPPTAPRRDPRSSSWTTCAGSAQAGANRMVVGSQARILYADEEGRTRIAAGLQRGHRATGEISRADRAGPRPPRRLRHRLALPRDRQHPRRHRCSAPTWPCRT